MITPSLLPVGSDYAWRIECPHITSHRLDARCRLLHLDPRQSGREVVLFLPPLSGHSSALIQDLAKPLSKTHDVYVLDWDDPVTLRKEDADYGINTQVNLTRKAIIHLSGTFRLHVVAICQAAAPTLTALSGLPPKNMTLTMAAAPLVDGPGGVCDLFQPDAAEATIESARNLTTRAGNGARVLPGRTQLGAILHGSGGAMRLLNGAAAVESMGFGTSRYLGAKSRRLALLDARSIPARLLLEGLRANFIQRQHNINPPHPDLPIHLVAGGTDKIVPKSQTFGFADKFGRSDIYRSLFSGLDHFDLFSSSTARREVSKKMFDFFDASKPSSTKTSS
jgi:hypothetical protein